MEREEAAGRFRLPVEVLVGETPIQQAAERAAYATPDHLARARRYVAAELRAALPRALALPTRREALITLRDHLEQCSPRARERLTAALLLLALDGELDAAYRATPGREALGRAVSPATGPDAVAGPAAPLAAALAEGERAGAS